jgi:peroxiredoxin
LLVGALEASIAATGQQGRFGERAELELVVPEFADEEIAQLVSTLDTILARETNPDKWTDLADRTLWTFARQLQGGRLTPRQEASVQQHLVAIEQARPDAASVLRKSRQMIGTLTIGKTAPDIVARDLDGAEMRLSDYRGKVVLVVFGGEWCAICRSQYPYQRFLLELYGSWPFAIVGVDSSRTPEAARQAKAEYGLNFRSWWDGRPVAGGDAPIASAWNVQGWPTVYLLDRRGVVRFVDLRNEDLLKGVRQLLTEQAQPPEEPARISQRTLRKKGPGTWSPNPFLT